MELRNKFLAQIKPSWNRNNCLALLCTRTKDCLKAGIDFCLPDLQATVKRCNISSNLTRWYKKPQVLQTGGFAQSLLMRHSAFTWKIPRSHLKPKKQGNWAIQSHQHSLHWNARTHHIRASFWEGSHCNSHKKRSLWDCAKDSTVPEVCRATCGLPPHWHRSRALNTVWD